MNRTWNGNGLTIARYRGKGGVFGGVAVRFWEKNDCRNNLFANCSGGRVGIRLPYLRAIRGSEPTAAKWAAEWVPIRAVAWKA